MYRDKTLIPTEAIRLCALGVLADAPMRYADLANEVRHFASRIVGYSLDILGPSLELLRYEGLTESTDSLGDPGEAVLSITETGVTELHALLISNVRAPVDDINKLVVALKFRFLHLLNSAEQRAQIEGLIEICHSELERLGDLRDDHGREDSHLGPWLDHDIDQLRSRIAWLEAYRDRI